MHSYGLDRENMFAFAFTFHNTSYDISILLINKTPLVYFENCQCIFLAQYPGLAQS